MKDYISTAIELIGAGLIIWAFSLVALPIAVGLAGLVILVAGYSYGESK
jgi:hypothetical protein